MFKVGNIDDAYELIFNDATGRECALVGMPAGTKEPDGLMLGLRNLDVLVEVNGKLKVARTNAIIDTDGNPIDLKLLRGAPMALTQALVAQLMPVLQYFVTHGTLPPTVALRDGDDDA